MKIFHRIEDHVCVVSIIGRFVGEEVLDIKEYCIPFIEDKNIGVLLFDLKEVTTLDSAGIGLIVEIYKIFQKREEVVAICNPKDNHMKVFEMIRLNKVLSIYATEEEALAEFAK
ncbi:MAG: STAS domain-containing protein [SAR324 cluster bacterium]|nr:STAS domain-containing protein [SAR324 cluster bacterium]